MSRTALSVTAARSSAEPTQQALKSAQTRARLIESTIRCLVKFGYAGTTTPKVASEASLSRGAMLHHFENGGALMQATIAELLDRRLRAFRRAEPRTAAGDQRHLSSNPSHRRPTSLACHRPLLNPQAA